MKHVVVLVVGQTPPPYHGQAIMIQMLLDGPLDGVKLHHVRMAFSENMDQVGKFQIGKVFHLIAVIVRVIWARLKYTPSILYYPPAGPNKIPIIRDTILLLITRWMFRKTIYHFQASGASELIPKLPSILRACVKRAMHAPDVVIQLSPLISQDAEFFAAKKTYTIPNAAEDHFQELGSEGRQNHRHGLAKSLLYLGTVCETKGILVLLDACSNLLGSDVDFHLDVVGSFQPASFGAVVIKKINDLGLSSHVSLHGELVNDKKWTMFANADLFCFPSHYESEGFPCVLVEAMSFGLPIVSTHWRGIPSIVMDGQTGYLVPPKDAEALGGKIRDLLVNDVVRTSFGNNARARYVAEFTRQRHLESMSAVFRDAVQ
jgi:glycosyltransferase involved in cell wall biosynthesis